MRMIQPILQYKSYFLFNIVPILVITISVKVSDDGTESGGCNWSSIYLTKSEKSHVAKITPFPYGSEMIAAHEI